MNENNDKNYDLSGFDSYTPGADTDSGETSPAAPAEPAQGYTVTPNGGYYNAPPANQPAEEESDAASSGNDDEVFSSKEDSGTGDGYYHYTGKDIAHNTDETSYTPHSQYGFFPSGNYGSYNNNSSNNGYGNNGYGGYGYSGQQGQSPSYTYPPVKPEKPPKAPKERKPKAERPKKYGFRAVVAAAVVAAIVGGSAGAGSFLLADRLSGEEAGPSASTSDGVKNININTTVESVVQAVAEKCGPSVVGIRTTAAATGLFGDTQESTGEGSGVIYSADGYIITNYHVIQEAAEQKGSNLAKVQVFLPSDPETGIAATIVGYNIAYDLAVVKIDKTGLPAIEFANSDDLSVGQYAIAIGNPGGLEFMGSVSYGIISGLNRKLTTENEAEMNLIQTDAAINPGNSGGALVDTTGKLIGINSVKLVAEGFEGMGFAIPVNTVVETAKDIIAHENQPTPYLGLEISTRYDSATLKSLGYPAGAVVQSVVTGGPADSAGIRRGDIITKFNGKDITSYATLSAAISSCTPGQKVAAEVYRGGRTYTTDVTVGANNGQ